ncbi:MAG: hypothetical protein A3K03_09275 [Bdellovibrionales bacterium RIFOXYD1_FULL_44_7]|nr:MAG: hypothetical protein A3K03_09275 [Bdellovibrionales bacterium RIFOXYD1_FULL_44_7]
MVGRETVSRPIIKYTSCISESVLQSVALIFLTLVSTNLAAAPVYSEWKNLGQNFGGLSSAFSSIQLDWDIFGLPVKPLIFFDAGTIENRAWKFEHPIYFSPGTGLSWLSPWGPMRATVATGFTLGNRVEERISHFQFYISFRL